MDKQEKGTERSGGGREGGREGRREGGGSEFSYDSWTSFFSLCVPHQMPIHGASGCWEAGEGDAHRHKAEVFAVLLTERRGRVGGREAERREKRCEERNYEFSA